VFLAITLPNVHRFSMFFQCWQRRKFSTKLIYNFSSYFKDVSTLPCEIKNIRNWHKMCRITIKSNHVEVSHTFNRLLILSQNLLKKSPLTCTQAHRCVCHSLIARRVNYLSAGQHSHKQIPRHCLVTGADNIAVQIIRSSSPTLTQWTTLSVTYPNSMSTSPACSKC